MEFKGTKGKWNHLDKSDLSVWADSGNKVCELVDKRYLGKTLPETWYNVLLIKKAPEMLEMLKIILKESEIDIIQGLDKLKVRKLIAEATEL